MESVKALLATLLIAVLLGISCMSLTACGGGTSGTGDDRGRVSLRGSVTSHDGQPIRDIRVIVAENGDEASTDASGQFAISTSLTKDNPLLILQGAGIDSTVTLQGVAKSATTVEVELSVSADKSSLEVVDIRVDVESTPQATPIATSTPVMPSNNTDKPRADYVWTILGTTKLPNGDPVAGARLRVSPGNVSLSTDSSGEFSTATTASGSKIVIEISYKGRSASTTIRNLPQSSDLQIKVQLIVRLDSSAVDPNNPGSGDSSLSLHVDAVSIRPK